MKRNKSKISCKRGFTLIELLVVVLIIGILAAVAVPQYRIAVAKARVTEALTVLKAITDAQEVYFLAHGQYTNDISNLDVSMETESKDFTYECKSKRLCIANPNNEKDPYIMFHMQRLAGDDGASENYLGKHWCIANHNPPAQRLAVCKALGTLDPDLEGYYILR